MTPSISAPPILDEGPIVSLNTRDLAALEHVPLACERHEIDGFYFEEGGCWGMALAIHDTYGGQIVVRQTDFVHAYVRVENALYDWQGLASDPPESSLQPVSAQALIELTCNTYGADEFDILGDHQTAMSVLHMADELHAHGVEPSEQTENLDRPRA